MHQTFHATSSKIVISFFDTKGRILRKKDIENTSILVRSLNKDEIEFTVDSSKTKEYLVTSKLTSKYHTQVLYLGFPELKCSVAASGVKLDLDLAKLLKLQVDGADSYLRDNEVTNAKPATPEKKIASEIEKIDNVRTFISKYSPLKSGCTPISKRNKISPSKKSISLRSPSIKLRQESLTIANLNLSTASITEYENLSPEQRLVIDACLTGENVFFTGGAGTGA